MKMTAIHWRIQIISYDFSASPQFFQTSTFGEPHELENGKNLINHLIFHIWNHNVEPNLYSRFTGNLSRNYRVLLGQFRFILSPQISVS
jgi:hypothetical protein